MAEALHLTVGGLLEDIARRYPDRDALVYPDRGLRYSDEELNALCDRMAKGLLKLGIGKGDHVSIWATNVPEWVVLQFATAKIGAVLVTINTSYRSAELAYVLGQSDATTLFLVRGFKDTDYGQTESSPVITQTRTDDPIELRVATVGRALPDVEVKIVDIETGETLPPGKQGELCSRGYLVMKGYYKMPEETAKAIDRDGWLHIGDLAVMDENGYVKITGRIKNMIIRGGENIYPREIEEFLYTHPKVSDVQVYGVPDRKYGEQVMAAFKLKDDVACTEEEIREFCRGRIANYKVPHYVRFVDAYPMTASGKIQKFKLREMAIRELGLEEAAGVETA